MSHSGNPSSPELPDTLQQWARHFNAGELDELCALYHPQATLWGTHATELAATPVAIRAYFARAFSLPAPPRVRFDRYTVSCHESLTLCAGIWVFDLGEGPNAARETARFSFSLAGTARSPRAPIVQHHSSPWQQAYSS